MKVTRVLLAANENPIYYEFWNPLSQVYAEKLGIKPTLIWFGKSEDIERLGLSTQYGEIIIQEIIHNEPIGWQTAWALFWYMKKYPDDVFCTMGIDQVPLSRSLIQAVPSSYSEGSYLMLADDGYSPSSIWYQDGGVSPTSFHICKGSTAQLIYGFEKTFEEEIRKISASGIKPYYDQVTKWGLDESYASHKLREAMSKGAVIHSSGMFKTICDNRIECCRTSEPQYDPSRLKSGGYSDAHLCRPFSHHKKYLETMLDLIPCIKL